MTLFTLDRLTGELTGFYLGKNTSASHRKAYIMARTLSILSQKAHLRFRSYCITVCLSAFFLQKCLAYDTYLTFSSRHNTELMMRERNPSVLLQLTLVPSSQPPTTTSIYETTFRGQVPTMTG